MSNIIVPLQSFGIGDIIFTQSLVNAIAAGKKILWGTEPQFIEGLTRAYPGVTFVDKKSISVDYNRRDDYVINDMRVLPIRFADSILNVPYRRCMRAKYDLYGMDWRNWKHGAQWNRDRSKEAELLTALGIAPGQQYLFVNTTFGSESQLKAAIVTDSKLPVVEMKTLPGFSLFDWAPVIEQATEIHTVSTSIIYLIELLELAADRVHLYPRKPIEKDFVNIDYLLQKHHYILHD